MAETALNDADPTDFRRVIIDVRRGAHGRYWTSIRTGLIIVSDNALSSDRPRAVVIPFAPDWSIRMLAAERLRAVWRGQTPPTLFTAQRRRRIGQALRTTDARQSGARLRDIAIAYFGAGRVAGEPWKTSALKAQVARLTAFGRTLVGDGYRQLLRGNPAARSPR
ncbi:DUF2285 domain-containing protein [uncultured Roseobacter sp.]|uniref:DUF2285 domain-containing protein n=1 Tax=uncultured Roseobacter sp. TaxID=114847 RepID=UPI0026335BB8|nr:DUF2285 domain-containing protein [uncultured Roseobacter sp.]